MRAGEKGGRTLELLLRLLLDPLDRLLPRLLTLILEDPLPNFLNLRLNEPAPEPPPRRSDLRLVEMNALLADGESAGVNMGEVGLARGRVSAAGEGEEGGAVVMLSEGNAVSVERGDRVRDGGEVLLGGRGDEGEVRLDLDAPPLPERLVVPLDGRSERLVVLLLDRFDVGLAESLRAVDG
jgi:hypothetical protein